MQKIIVTGSSGLIGSKLVAALGEKYDFVPWTSQTDITKRASVEAALDAAGRASALVHLAAYTNVNGAFEQTDNKSGPAWQINVVGTQNIAATCAARGLYLIHLSTAYVFDGRKSEPYVETDTPNPIEWYGRTKYEAEQAVLNEKNASVILRIDQPFSRTSFKKVDTLWRVIAGLKKGDLYPQFTNHYFGPTYIEDLIKTIDWALRRKPTGLYHASNGEQWSDYDFAQRVNEILQLGASVAAGDLDTYLQTTARPYQRNTAMNNQRLTEILDFQLASVEAAIAQVRLK